MRNFSGSLIALLLGATMTTTTLQAGVIYDSGGFEAPTFAVGDLNNQNGWKHYIEGTSVASDVAIQTQHVYEGNQAIQLKDSGSRLMARYYQTITQNNWVDVMLLTPTAAEIQTNLTIQIRGKDSANVAKIYASISLNASGSVNDVPPGPNNSYTLGAWNRFTVRLDLTNDTWDLYINNQLAGANLNFVGNADVTSITNVDFDWRSKVGATGNGVGIDNFIITDANPIPEPTAGVMLSALSGLLLARWR